MNLARRIGIATSAWLLALAVASPALAQFTPEPARYFGHYLRDAVTNNATWSGGPVTDATGDVYNNTNPQSPANFGFVQTDLSTIMGDRVSTTGKGTLNENDFTVYNSSSSAGPVLTAVYAIRFYDASSLSLLGGYNTSINFGGGLPPGFFAIITTTNLLPAAIVLNTQDVLVTQQIVSITGTASAVGIASLDPPNIGSSANTMFLSSGSIPAGYYNIGNPPLNANPGYRINVDQSTPAMPSTWGHVKSLYHS